MVETDPAIYGDSWYAANMTAVPARAALALDIDVDVCVIGGGLAGLTAAREIARLGWSVALLEARRIAWNASGRNCGFAIPGFGEDIRKIVERVGLDHARELWALSEAGLDYMRRTILEIPNLSPVDGWLDVSKVDHADDLVARVSLLGQELGAEIEGWSTERVREVLASPLYFHAIHFPKAFHINPLAYALGLADAAEQAGVRIFEDTPALSIDPTGVRKRIVTPSARVRAGHVVLAGNTHLGQLMPEIGATLLPITSFVAVSARLGDRLDTAMSYRGAVSDTQAADHHYRIVDDDRLMWAGGLSMWDADPRRWKAQFSQAVARTYPQLGAIEFDYVWSGVLGMPLHRMPQIGEVSPGLWLASGFGSHGLNTSAMAGELVARAVVENDDRWRLFAPYNLVWAGGKAGRVVLQGAYWATRARENIESRLARRREHAQMNGVATAPETEPEPPQQPEPDMSHAAAGPYPESETHTAYSDRPAEHDTISVADANERPSDAPDAHIDQASPDIAPHTRSS